MKASIRIKRTKKGITLLKFTLLAMVGLTFAGNALAQVANVQARYAGAEAGYWGGKKGSVIGSPDGTCAAMGAENKVNLVSAFNFSIPDGATITGVTLYAKAGESDLQVVKTQLATNAATLPPTGIGSMKDLNTDGTSNNCNGTVLTPLGGNLAFWGNPALTPGIVSDPGFGLIFTKAAQSNVKFDSACVEVAYTTTGGDPVSQSCTAAPPPPSNTIKVVKSVVGSVPGADWSFGSSGVGIGSFVLPAEGGFHDFAGLNSGSYTITETAKAGYTVTSECLLEGEQVATGNEQITVSVSGDQLYTCIFTNALNSSTFTVSKTYSDANETPVTVTASCTNGGTFEANPLTAAPGAPAIFTYTGYDGNSTCTAVETNVPDGYVPNISDCQDNDALGGGCNLVNTALPAIATFKVTKTFSDGSTALVSVKMTCTGQGDYPTQSFMIAGGDPGGATFTLQDFINGEPTCEIAEVPVDGYKAIYNDGEGCVFEAVSNDPGQYVCNINNRAKPATFTANKVWFVPNPGGDFFDDDVQVTIVCQSKITTEGAVKAENGRWRLSGTVGDGESLTATVKTVNGPARCRATEQYSQSGVEAEDDCGWRNIAAGEASECTFTNTVFFEDIPTLNQYGMALLALLMLGLGVVGIRRFA